MWRTLAAIGAELPDDVRVVVLRGAGATFSAGLDRTLLAPGGGDGQESVADLLAQADEAISATIDDYQQGFTWLRDPRFVSIAVVHGYAIGAGFQLALSCDLIAGRRRRLVLHEGGGARPGPRPHGNKTAGRGGWLLEGAGDLRHRPQRGRRGGGAHRPRARRRPRRPARHPTGRPRRLPHRTDGRCGPRDQGARPRPPPATTSTPNVGSSGRPRPAGSASSPPCMAGRRHLDASQEVDPCPPCTQRRRLAVPALRPQRRRPARLARDRTPRPRLRPPPPAADRGLPDPHRHRRRDGRS